MIRTKLVSVVVAFVLLAAYFPVEARPLAPASERLLARLQQQTADTLQVSYHSETGKVRFIGTAVGHPIPPATRLPEGAAPETAARQFLGTYGSLFGLKDADQELRVMRQGSAEQGTPFVRFQQLYQGVPVFGGELIVNLTAAGEVTSANGEILPDLALATTPQVSAAVAQERASAVVAKAHGLNPASLVASEPELWIYHPALLGAPGPRFNALVWRMTVQSLELLPIRELVLIDAHLGAVALHFNQIDTALYRQIYDNENLNYGTLPGPNLRRSEGQAATGNSEVDQAYDFAGDTYNYYQTNHGRDSLDNAGMQLISTVRYCPSAGECPYENAFWNGEQMVYGQGYTAGDDVVAHEMTHGVTDYESSLFYFMQSGAINEALSDIWGELVDQGNGKGNDAPAVRWLMGEDLPIGAIRSMSNPPLYSQPDRMNSSFYYCGSDDNGGVHYNSGVANKTAFLLVDGGFFNGQTVTPLGGDKTAKLFYEFQTHYATSASDYQDLNDALGQACTSLIGQGITTAADCQEVSDALAAVAMSQQPTLCAAPEAPLCIEPNTVPVSLFFDNVENPASGKWWTGTNVGTSRWFYPQNTNPFGFDGPYATSGVGNIWGYDQEFTSDFYLSMSSDLALPNGKTAYLHFAHSYFFDAPVYDGGVLEYSNNGGTTWTDSAVLFSHNGYSGVISSAFGNPLAGRSAFVGDSNGYISSRLSLSSLTGQSVRFRFRIGTDGSDWDYGWFIDDINIFTCENPSAAAYKGFLPLLQRGISGAVQPTITPPAPPTPTATQPPPSGPTAGFWESLTGDEFYVTPDQAYVDNFAIYISVPGCGNYKITRVNQVPISANQFSFSGEFYASGMFVSSTLANGEDGLNNLNIFGCGSVSGGPWNWEATWQNSSQPTWLPAHRTADQAQVNVVEPAPAGHYYQVEKIK